MFGLFDQIDVTQGRIRLFNYEWFGKWRDGTEVSKVNIWISNGENQSEASKKVNSNNSHHCKILVHFVEDRASMIDRMG